MMDNDNAEEAAALDKVAAVMGEHHAGRSIVVPECCGNCDFFNSSNPQSFECRARPPMATLLMKPPRLQGQQPEMVTMSVFPPMRPEGWCGDWAPIDYGRERLGGGINKLPSGGLARN